MTAFFRPSSSARRSLALIGLAIGASLSACNCGTRILTNEPKISVTPAKVDFGSVAVGSVAEHALEVTNTGRAPLLISSVTVVDMGDVTVPAAELLVSDCENNPRSTPNLMQLQLGDCARISVRFAPKAQESISTKVQIVSNDPTQPKVLIPVTATGAVQPYPKIEVCALDDNGMQVDSDCTDFTTMPPTIPTIAFGTVEYQDTGIRKLRIINNGTSNLIVSTIRMQATTADLGLQDLPMFPTTIAPSMSADVQVTLSPSGTGPVTGKVVILSNDSGEMEVDIPVTGYEDGPCLQLMPTGTMDFGSVPVGMSKQLQLSLENCGHSTYQITKLVFTPDMASSRVFNLSSGDPTGLPATPFTFNPGDMHTLILTYSPVLASAPTEPGDTGTFTISTSYNASEVVHVVGHGAGAECDSTNTPTATIAAAQNGSAVGASVLPLSTVTFSGTSSSNPSGSATASYAWRLISAPTNNMSMLSSTSGATTSLLCSLAGDYVVGLTVKSANGCQSPEATYTVHVVPGQGIHVQLTWPQNYGDLDLHYVGPGGSLFDMQGDQGDLYYPYAKASFDGTTLIMHSPNPLDWGLGNTTNPDGNPNNDPSLDVDQLWGKGPENVTHPNAFQGDYQVMVHYYCSSAFDQGGSSTNLGPGTATVTIYFDGNQIWQGQKSITAKQVWTAATIHVGAGGTAATVTPGTSVYRSSEGCADGN